eukprot:TRINITY_DN17698_c0_g2_i1.p1 TRINITY_DN17698_c0_g2~~TRINITY_DN17698_c0_g2_i1.p1  ORF type:complete len:433 (-),score=75.12 TRINITY_DN17698_c0_g2_i1:711-2009(-)
MFRLGIRRAATSASSLSRLQKPLWGSHLSTVRSFGTTNGSDSSNPVALQMINYALGHARSQKSEESYAHALLVLEQGLANLRQADSGNEDGVGMVLLAMSTLLSEREQSYDAIEKLLMVLKLDRSSLGMRVAAYEGVIGLILEEGKDVIASIHANRCLQLFPSRPENEGNAIEDLYIQANAIKGLVELVKGNIVSAELHFRMCQFNDLLEDKWYMGNVALSLGKFLHATGHFALAKDFYQMAVKASEINGSSKASTLAAANIISGKVSLGAICALGQLATHSGNFTDAEEILTKALTKAEEHFGSSHPNVGVVLICIAIMFGHKAKMEQSSSILIQEGLYRRAIDLLKAPSLDLGVVHMPAARRDMWALARGGYAEVLCVQQNRKGEGERMKSWAEYAWMMRYSRRLSLADALEITEPSKVAIIDARVHRVI